jgi:hypothetical protein
MKEEDLGVDGIIIVNGSDLREIGSDNVDWNSLYQDRDQRWALANTFMNLRDF